jgi:hypothetical protein
MSMRNNKCFYCELTFGSSPTTRSVPLRKTNDHIIPRSKDGVNNPINYVESCHQCNHLKGSRLPEEFSEFLEYKIIATSKGVGAQNCFSVDRLQKVLDNNKKLIKIIEPYRNDLIKKYNPGELKSLKIIANRLREETLTKRMKQAYGYDFNTKKVDQKPPCSIISKNEIEKYLSEPEPNFHES